MILRWSAGTLLALRQCVTLLRRHHSVITDHTVLIMTWNHYTGVLPPIINWYVPEVPELSSARFSTSIFDEKCKALSYKNILDPEFGLEIIHCCTLIFLATVRHFVISALVFWVIGFCLLALPQPGPLFEICALWVQVSHRQRFPAVVIWNTSEGQVRQVGCLFLIIRGCFIKG